MSFKILLIAPPIFDFYFTPARSEPLGLLYIRERLSQIDGVEVFIHDANQSGRKKPVQTPACFDYLREFYVEDSSRFSLLQRYFRFGDSFAKISRQVADNHFDLVAISSLFSAYHPDVEELVRTIKAQCRVPVAVGGWAVFAATPAELSAGAADYYITGDGEDVLPQLIAGLIADGEVPAIAGLVQRSRPETSNGRKSHTADDSPPFFVNRFPRRDTLHRFRGKSMASMIISKGCRLRCAFCSIHGRYRFRVKPIELIRQELAYLFDLGIEIVNFEDDNLFADQAYASELLALLTDYHSRGMQFAAMNGITAINLLPLIDKVLDAGFFELNLSMVSSDPGVLRTVSRPAFLEAIATVSEKALGRAEVLAFVIAGLPHATVQGLIDDIVALARLPLRIGFSPLYLLPGVPFFNTFTLPDDHRLLRGSALYAFGRGFTRADIASLWKYVRMINHLKSATLPLSPDDDENLGYFKQSLHEKQWYARRRDGTWYPTFHFDTALPPDIAIADNRGTIVKWQWS
jgi:radical SAM superfamily enzyme YgiQ (UPF0313 family)